MDHENGDRTGLEATDPLMENWIIVGNHECSEFGECVRWLKNRVACTFATNLDAIDQLVSKNPATILFLISFRGQFTHRRLEVVQSRLPLTRFIGICGSWCEGETRSGSPFIGMERVYVHEFVPKMMFEFSRSVQFVSVPKTTSGEEIWLHRGAESKTDSAGTVVVVGCDKSICSAIATACHRFGFRTVWTNEVSEFWVDSADFVVYDADRDTEVRRKVLLNLKKRFPNAKTVLLVDFPRTEERMIATQDGVDLVLSKPFDIHALNAILTV